MCRLSIAAFFSLFCAFAAAQTAAIVPVTVTWTAPTDYEAVTGIAAAVALETAPAGKLTDGVYSIYSPPDGQAFGLELSVTVSNGLVTSVAVLNGGNGYAVGDVESIYYAPIAGATANGTVQITTITNDAAVQLPASDIDHYTIWWSPAGGTLCQASNCIRGPYGVAFAPAGTLTYTIAGACGNLDIEVAVATNAGAYAPFAQSNPVTITENTGVTCPVLKPPATVKLAWPKL